MGDRAQIKIEDNGVFLYTHWCGSELKDTLKQALIRGESRWNDSEYLTRIIFCEMIQHDDDSLLKTTGYGISTSKHVDLEHNLLVVNCEEKTVTELHPDDNHIMVPPM
jgi:hypothetical protein